MKKYILIILSIMCILLFVGCSKKEVANEDIVLLADEFWHSVTEIVYYDFDETVYKLSNENKLEELQEKIKIMKYKEIKNPWLEGWYHFEIHTKQNIYEFLISGKTICFDGKFYKVTDSISEEVTEIIKSE